MIDNEEWVMKKLSKWIGNIPFYFALNQIFSIKSSSGDLSLASIKPGSYWV